MEADSGADRRSAEQAIDFQAAAAAAQLSDTSWQLVQLQGPDGTTLVPDQRTQYTIAFAADGRVHLRLDCNRGRSTWTVSEPNQLQFGPLAVTRALCPPGSLYDRVVRDLAAVRSYRLEAGHLFLSLMMDSGVYEFEPMF